MSVNPRIIKSKVGVKFPLVGAGERVAVGEGLRLGEGRSDGEGETLGEADGVAGSVTWVPLAKTVNLRVTSASLPLLSLVVMVTVCSPGVRPVGGVQVQLPLWSTLVVPVSGVPDSTFMVTICPGTPVPLKTGLSEGIAASVAGLDNEGLGVATAGRENLGFELGLELGATEGLAAGAAAPPAKS